MVSNSRTISFIELNCFEQIARAGGVSAAADSMGLSKSAVSKHISRLEGRLGVRLLERSSRRVRLTAAGERLLPRVDSLLADGERLLEQATEERSEPAGLVRVAATPELGAVVAQRLLPAVNERYPALEIAMTPAYRFEDLQDPQFDFAIRVGRVADDRLVAKRLGSFRRVLVASPSYLVRHPVKGLEDLSSLNALIFSGRRTQSIWSFVQANMDASEREESRPFQVEVRGALAIQSFSTLAEMAVSGLGVAYVPDFVAARGIESGTLRRCLPEFCSVPTTVMLAYRAGSQRIRRVRVVLDMALEAIPRLLTAATAD